MTEEKLTSEIPELNKENLTKETISKIIKNAHKSTDLRYNPIAKESTDDPVHYSDWLALCGFESEEIALQYIQSGIVQPIQNKNEWLTNIHQANETVFRIKDRQKVVPEVQELDSRFQEHINKLQSEPTFKELTSGFKSARFALVELGKIHCYQKHLNMEYVNYLIKKAPDPQDLESTIKFCLPTKDETTKTEVLSAFNPETNTVCLLTENLDFRILGSVGGEDPTTKRNYAGFVYGFGLHQISVANYKGIFLLKNGYNRAFALFKKGHKFLPCILVETDDFQLTGAQRPGFFSIDLIMSEKSPILSDFTTGSAIIVPRRRLKAMITVHAELQVIPS